MAKYTLQCPNCGVQRAAHNVVGCGNMAGTARFLCLQCPTCNKPFVAFLKSNTEISQLVHYAGSFGDFANPNMQTSTPFLFGGTVPQQTTPEAPAGTPDDVARVFIQAKSAAARQERDTASMAFRKVVDLTIKAVDPGGGREMLGPRLRRLAIERGLHPHLLDWAEQVRELGNEGAHDATEPTAEDIEDLEAFVTNLLNYLFTMPERLEARKRSSEKAGA